MVIKMNLKEYRKELGITIKEASNTTNVPLRTYIRYENDDNYGDELKRNQIFVLLKQKYQITEENGILSVDQIKYLVSNVLDKYKEEVSFCYLFGSYAKGYATSKSDVDLCVSTTLKGMEFVGIIEELKDSLNKKVDLIRISDMENNIELIKEILKDGLKIYG